MLGIAPRYKKHPVVEGPGECGKSVLLAALSACFPPDAVSAVPPHEMGLRFGLSDLVQARYNAVSELSSDPIRCSDRAKAVLSGDTIQAEAKYGDPFAFAPRAGHIFACNEAPTITDAVLLQRLVPIRLVHVVPEAERDPHLIDALRLEAPLISSLAVRHAADLLARGAYEIPDAVSETRWDWLQDDNPLATELWNLIEPSPGEFLSSQDIIEDLKFEIPNQPGKTVTPKRIASTLTGLGFARAREPGTGLRGWAARWRPRQ